MPAREHACYFPETLAGLCKPGKVAHATLQQVLILAPACLLCSQAPLTIDPHIHPLKFPLVVLQAVVVRVCDEIPLNKGMQVVCLLYVRPGRKVYDLLPYVLLIL